MKDAPVRIGVVIPTLDEDELLGRLLERLGSAPEGADRADEVLVVDGGSRDRTVELARGAGVPVLRSAPGRGAQLAAGARAVECSVLLFLHADSLPAPGALASLRRRFEAGCDAAGMRQRIEADGWFYRMVERVADARVRHFEIVYGDSGLCVRRSTYEAVGGFREWPLFEDLDLSRRLRRVASVTFADDAVLAVSARRWQREGPLRRALGNACLTALFFLGMSPDRLVRYYRPERRSP